MRSVSVRLILLGCAVVLGCAQGAPRGGDAGRRFDAEVPEVDARTGGDATASPDVGPVTVDSGAPDVGPGAPDVGPLDLGPTVPDAGPVDSGPTGGPTACTPANATAVCGTRPCVDGFCCDGPCTGACRSCAVAGMEGRCVQHAAATDPDNECADQAASTCGTTGMCNGAGACAQHPMGTPCDDGASCTTGDACDGTGMCRGAAPAMCQPAAGNECCLGSCDMAAGCRTTPGLCADQCDPNRLQTGRTCQGCGAPRAAGACMGGGVFTCDATTNSLCQAISCGGQSYVCSNDGGVWQWRTATRCDDGNACTHGDTCNAGACRGTTIACTSDACMTRACNGTATCTQTPRTGMACDDGDLCTRSDTCSASGTCTSGARTTCTSDACMTRACNGTATCTETPRTGACDDGNACTFGETCNAGGMCGAGTAINCDAMDTTCRDFSCNGTGTCASTPRTGAVCDDGNATTTGDVCTAAGVCMGMAGCALPTDACATGTQTRDGCTSARVIGRQAAASAAGYSVTGDTCSARNRFDDCSWDAGYDHAYRIWMRTGETLTLTLTRSGSCYSSWSATLKLYRSAGCADVRCSGDLWCRDGVGTGAQTYVATQEGWMVVVVDGSTAFDDEGSYTLRARLSGCRVAGCECP